MLQQLKDNWKLALAGLVVLVLIVMAFCWWLWKPAPPVPEVYKPAVHQADGSVVLEKKPDAQAVPKQIIPKGATVERVVSITVQPWATVPAQPTHAGFQNRTTAQPARQCPPVTVDLSLIREANNMRRVVASSPDGAVVGGMDIPVEDAAPPPAPKLWAAGIAVDPLRRTGGVFVDRDVAFLRLGAQVNQRELGGLPNQIWLKAGIRW